ncbi:hypothetical protein EGI94_00130 [Stutzerimonas stutzeri]|uniref:hypothetical protein n=1 Tax=Stutzerimonas stutzeri TaxID=316 RepID=UPI000F793C46|nr:hypothetical protein [Stutzerimonas stutzeri]RRV35554.1 hypothetical protein EGI94_00130 [Stutzerimonas stutzeri]
MEIIDIGTHRIEFQPPSAEGTEPPIEQVPIWIITPYALLRRFDQAERLTVRTAAQSDPAIDDWLSLVQAAQHIDLQHIETVAGINYLAEQALITPERAEQILGTSAEPHELP